LTTSDCPIYHLVSDEYIYTTMATFMIHGNL